ncbi:MAG TPA: TetR/AcrR family transcriptional regulator [Candidatus Blautia excrementipullorum]|nr:TetR/AcrR family transcriptional regulator [Candidatus Blautia excrementipullorum]
MRITKEPEERKQEIFDAALKLFGEKGYEKTTITDIAKSIGVAQGLCYRYFPSKEVLFDSAIEQYADILAAQFVKTAEHTHMPLKQFIEEMPLNVEDQNTKYYAVFHGPQNRKFHNQLSLKTCEKLVPVIEKMLQKARENGEIQLEDLKTAAMFCVYGQLGILLNDDMDQREKTNRIRKFLIYVLRL